MIIDASGSARGGCAGSCQASRRRPILLARHFRRRPVRAPTPFSHRGRIERRTRPGRSGSASRRRQIGIEDEGLRAVDLDQAGPARGNVRRTPCSSARRNASPPYRVAILHPDHPLRQFAGAPRKTSTISTRRPAFCCASCSGPLGSAFQAIDMKLDGLRLALGGRTGAPDSAALAERLQTLESTAASFNRYLASVHAATPGSRRARRGSPWGRGARRLRRPSGGRRAAAFRPPAVDVEHHSTTSPPRSPANKASRSIA